MRPAIKRLIIVGVAVIVLGGVAAMFLTFRWGVTIPDVTINLNLRRFQAESPLLPPAWLATIDQILENLELAQIGFNTPTTLQLGDSAVIQLLLSTQKSIEELQAMITAAGEREGAHIRVSEQMEAHLSGLGFKIEAITPEAQAVSATNVTEWKWEIEPTESGPQRLHLTLSALLHVEGQRMPRAIRTFERTIEVRVTWPQRASAFVADNWQWLWTTLFIPVVGWIIRKRKKQKTSHKRKGYT